MKQINTFIVFIIVLMPRFLFAQNPETKNVPVGSQGQDIQAVTERVDLLIKEIHSLTKKVNEGIDPVQLRQTLSKLNKTLDNASQTLAPEGGLNSTAQRTLAKLEDAIEQLRDIMARVNRGEGSVGMLLNDPTYAEELKTAIKSVNQLLSKVNKVRFVVDVGGEQHPAYDDGRAWFRLAIWPTEERYYLLGITIDPRGRVKLSTTTTTSGSTSTTVQTRQVEQNGLLLTGMLGHTFFNHRLDVALGALHGDGALSLAFNLGPSRHVKMFRLQNDIYSRGEEGGTLEDRLSLILDPFYSRKPFHNFYLKAGIESFRKYNGDSQWFVGAGLSFDDEDIKLLFALR